MCMYLSLSFYSVNFMTFGVETANQKLNDHVTVVIARFEHIEGST